MLWSRRRFLEAAGMVAFLAACDQQRPHPAGAPAPPATSATTTTAPAERATPATPTTSGGPARSVRAGPVDSGAVALTFHGSGDPGLLYELLQGARRSGAPITIFAVGQWLDANPQVTALITAGGHELANHTYTHPSLGGLGRTAVATEITRCRDALIRHAGGPGRWFRPSGIDQATELMLEEAGRAGYRTVVGFDVDPHDYQDPGADAVVSRTRAGLHPGAIVSLHTGHAGTVAAFEPIVAAIGTLGLRPVLLRDLLTG